MSDRPRVICLMSSSIDGGLHPSRFTASPDGTPKQWSGLYEALHDALAGDAWMVGRATMAEMAKGEPHPAAGSVTLERPLHVARRDAKPYAVAVDTHGRLRFRGGEVGGDQVVVLLGRDVPDEHLAELAANGVSYLVSDVREVDLAASLSVLRREFGVERLLLEGGGSINGSLMAAGLVDELHVVVAPALDGRRRMEGVVSAGDDGLAGRVRLSLRECRRLDHGAVHLAYDVIEDDNG